MSRLLSLLSICVVASATVSVVVAQPKKAPETKKAPDAKKPDAKKPDPKKGPVAPAKDPAPTAPGAGSGAGSGSGSGSGAAVPPPAPEEPPPKDIEGREENPGSPLGIGTEEPPKVVVPVKKKSASSGYPIEEYLRPINLPANMSEVAIGPHAQLGGDGQDYAGADALRARYGITREVQLGLTYVLGGIYEDPLTTEDKTGFHGGKAVGIDVTVLLQNWIGIRVGVPFYIKPVAFSLAIGVPIRFQLGDKFAIGGLDDFLNIKLSNFAPTFYQEVQNARNAQLDDTNATRSAGQLRVTGYGIYQHKPKTAFIGRVGFNMEDFASTKTQSNAGGGISYFLRAGVQWTPRKFIDLGISLGFDDLATYGSFGPQGLLAFRI